jgi:hypothetical protein
MDLDGGGRKHQRHRNAPGVSIGSDRGRNRNRRCRCHDRPQAFGAGTDCRFAADRYPPEDQASNPCALSLRKLLIRKLVSSAPCEAPSQRRAPRARTPRDSIWPGNCRCGEVRGRGKARAAAVENERSPSLHQRPSQEVFICMVERPVGVPKYQALPLGASGNSPHSKAVIARPSSTTGAVNTSFAPPGWMR